jgi:hypothetical protein
MEVEVRGGVLYIKAKVNCLECQFLHRPNPDEDVFICLRSLKTVTHELDEPIFCEGFDELRVHWVPSYDNRVGTYV